MSKMSIMIGLGSGLGTLLVLSLLWILERRGRLKERMSGGLLAQGIGFGFLPAAAVLNAFIAHDPLARGLPVPRPLAAVPWLTEDGCFLPARIHLACGVILFLAVAAWLILSRREPGPGGDLLMTSLCLWAALRIVTDGMCADPRLSPGGHPVLRYAACLALLGCLAVWTGRGNRNRKNRIQSLGNWIGALLSAGAVALTSEKALTTGSEAGDLAVLLGAAALMLALTLTAGVDSRREAAYFREGQS